MLSARRTRLVLLAIVPLACSIQDAATKVDSSTTTPERLNRKWSADSWRPPKVDSTPSDAYGASVFRGLALLTGTRDSLKAYVAGSA